MKLPILFMDELRGFYKSKVMIFLWAGLPILAIIFRFIQEYSIGQTISFTIISSLVVSSIAGTLAAVMLSVSIINEKNRHIYELFLIRPVRRPIILLAKFLSVYVCVAIASILAIFVGVATDWITTGFLASTVVNNVGQSLAISLSMVAVACSVGVLIGIASPSVLVGASTSHLRRKPIIHNPHNTHLVKHVICNGLHNWLSGTRNDGTTTGGNSFV